ncbi:MAG: helix-turn-helix domain-containing protein [Acidobacteria bacterium]|nr:helix-turn-helix domain-containing protein [Acidobacteriota bacterium]
MANEDEADLPSSNGKFGNTKDDSTADEQCLGAGNIERQPQGADDYHGGGSTSQEVWVTYNATSNSKLLVTVSEAGRVLAISRSKVYELMDAGDIPSVCIGRSRRIRVSDLESFVASVERQ